MCKVIEPNGKNEVLSLLVRFCGYSFMPLSFVCGCTGRSMPCLNLSNCSRNHSPMGRKSIVRMNLPPSEKILALTSFAMNFRLCSTEYNSPLYSMGLPVNKVAVCSLLKPPASTIFQCQSCP